MNAGFDAERIAREAAARAFRTNGADHADPEPRPLYRPLPPAQPFPVDALGGRLRRAAEAVHLRTQAPMALGAQSVLAAAALAVQGHANVALPSKETKPCSLFLMSVGESGERKSACDDAALAGVEQRKRELQDQYDGQLPDYLNRQEAWEKARAEATGPKVRGFEAKRAALEALGPAPTAPLAPLLTTDEGTFEGLFRLLRCGQPSVGLFASEAGAFLGGHGMTEEAKIRTAAGLTHLWDGSPLHRVRAGEDAIVLRGRRLSAHLMAQPAVAALLTRDPLIAGSSGQGLVNRFLIAAPETAAGTRMFREVHPSVQEELRAFAVHVRNLLARKPPLAMGKQNELTPRALALSNGARAEWIAFQHATEREIGPGGHLEPVRGLGNKLPEHATRLAAVLTLFDDLEAAEITVEAMGSGIVLAQFYGQEALRLGEAAEIDATLRKAEIVRAWLIRDWPEPVIGLPELYQRGPRCIRSQKAAREVVELLESHWHLRREPDGAVVAGNRRRDAWTIIGKERRA